MGEWIGTHTVEVKTRECEHKALENTRIKHCHNNFLRK